MDKDVISLDKDTVEHLRVKLRTAWDTLEHLKTKIHDTEQEKYRLCDLLTQAQRRSDCYEGLWNKLKAEVFSTFAQHSLSPQLLYAYIEGQEELALLEHEG